MAKHQSRTPGRDVRGGRGKGQMPAGPRAGRPTRADRGQRQGRPDVDARQGRGRGQRRPARGEGRDRRAESMPAGLIEGRRAVAEALDAATPLSRAYVAAGAGSRDARLDELVGRLEAAGVPVEEVARERLDAISSHGAHQGIAVRTRPFRYAELADVVARAGTGDALVVVLDHVTDEGNFGAIVRSAEVVGAAGVVIPKARAARVGTAAYKTSAGAVLHLPIAQVPNLADALGRLKEAGFWAVGSTEHAEQAVWDEPMPGRCALVMGSEGEGISRLVLDRCDLVRRLPQRGVVESLNVAQATTVMCYEWLRSVSGPAAGAAGGR